jgi:hypothetical protein
MVDAAATSRDGPGRVAPKELIQPHEFPYVVQTGNVSRKRRNYRGFDLELALIGYDEWKKKQAAQTRPKYIGIVCCGYPAKEAFTARPNGGRLTRCLVRVLH